MIRMVHHRQSNMPSCIVVCFLVCVAAPTSSFHAAASSGNSHAHRTPTLKWKQRGVRALLQTPVTVNSSNGTGPPTSYSTSVAPSGAVIINVINNNNNNNNNAPNANNNNANNNGNGNASPSPSSSPNSSPNSSPSGSGSVVPLATGGSSPSPDNNNNNNNNNNGNTGALPSGAPPVQQGTTVTQGSSSQCDINGPNCCSDQGQNSRLLPVNSGASLSSIVTSIYNAVPSGATYSPPSSVSLGYGVSAGANGRIAVNSGSRGLDAFEAAVLALNLPASSGGVNYQFSQGSFICVPNLYSSSGAPVLVQPMVYSNGFNSGGSDGGNSGGGNGGIPGGSAGGVQPGGSGNPGYGQNAYRGNPYGTRYQG